MQAEDRGKGYKEILFAEVDKKAESYEKPVLKQKQTYVQYDPTNTFLILSRGINENQTGKAGQI